ncbi:MAG: hypothetical protein HY698_21495 [Deltaproteobacteria bacterium]|nr:hypothetical protein [Deltaproteobacteria bacterium]
MEGATHGQVFQCQGTRPLYLVVDLVDADLFDHWELGISELAALTDLH